MSRRTMNLANVEAIQAAIEEVLRYFRGLPIGSHCWVDPATYIPTDRLAEEIAARGVLAVDSLAENELVALASYDRGDPDFMRAALRRCATGEGHDG